MSELQSIRLALQWINYQLFVIPKLRGNGELT